MICIAQPRLWICCLRFQRASGEEIASGFLGRVSCHVCGTIRLRPMRVRRRYDGRVTIKVRRGGRDQYEVPVRIDDETREQVHELILADVVFRAALRAIGVVVPRRQP